MQAGYLLGIDGGASKTAGVAVDRDGRVLARARVAGSAITGKPKPESCRVLASLVDALCGQAGTRREDAWWCGLGLNGVDFEDELPGQHADISEAIGLPRERVTLVNDGIVALWGATSAPAAAMIQHGSGFTAAYRSDYGRETLFDHLAVGGVFDMRTGLVQLVARMIFGMAPATPLKERALAFFAVEEARFCEAIYRGRIPWPRVTQTMPLIFECWEQGDAGADQLVQTAVADYALAAKAMIAATGSRAPDVALGGGLLASAPDRFWALVTERIRAWYPDLVATAPRLSPEFGAAVMAAHRAGLAPRPFFESILAHLDKE